MITNAISLIGSRGHLCGAFSDIMTLYRQKRIPLGSLVTRVVDGLEPLCALLEHPEELVEKNCKVLLRLRSGNVRQDDEDDAGR